MQALQAFNAARSPEPHSIRRPCQMTRSRCVYGSAAAREHGGAAIGDPGGGAAGPHWGVDAYARVFLSRAHADRWAAAWAGARGDPGQPFHLERLAAAVTGQVRPGAARAPA